MMKYVYEWISRNCMMKYIYEWINYVYNKKKCMVCLNLSPTSFALSIPKQTKLKGHPKNLNYT